MVIFDSIKPNYDTIFFDDGAQSITTASVLTCKLSPTNTIELRVDDSIVITPEMEYIILKHRYNPNSKVDILLREGDTMHIKYIDGIPFANIINRNTNIFDINYDYLKRKKYSLIEGMQLADVMENPSLITAYNLYKKKRILPPQVLDKYYPEYLKELEAESAWLDSIYQNKQITGPEYHFYKDRNKYNALGMKLRDKGLDYVIKELEKYNDSIYTNDLAGYYRTYFQQLALNYANTISQSFKENIFTQTYDFVDQGNKAISGELLLYVRVIVLQKILENSPIRIRQEYFSKFASSVSDEALIRRLEETYDNLLNPEIALTDDFILLSPSGQKITFSEVLKQLKGKKIYVDFWASWCEPCLMEMPVSKQLRNNSVYKDVTFVYLALNDKEERWKAAWKKAGVENYRHNYLILNSKDAFFIEKYKISTIPRYMLIDEDGKIVNSNAQKPSDVNIKRILTGHE